MPVHYFTFTRLSAYLWGMMIGLLCLTCKKADEGIGAGQLRLIRIETKGRPYPVYDQSGGYTTPIPTTKEVDDQLLRWSDLSYNGQGQLIRRVDSSSVTPIKHTFDRSYTIEYDQMGKISKVHFIGSTGIENLYTYTWADRTLTVQFASQGVAGWKLQMDVNTAGLPIRKTDSKGGLLYEMQFDESENVSQITSGQRLAYFNPQYDTKLNPLASTYELRLLYYTTEYDSFLFPSHNWLLKWNYQSGSIYGNTAFETIIEANPQGYPTLTSSPGLYNTQDKTTYVYASQ